MINIGQHLKSRTNKFNTVMALIDMLIINAAFVADLMTVKQFAFTIITLKVLQTVGNYYYRSITTEAIEDK